MKKSIFIVVNEDINKQKQEKKFTNKNSQSPLKSTNAIIKNYVLIETVYQCTD